MRARDRGRAAAATLVAIAAVLATGYSTPAAAQYEPPPTNPCIGLEYLLLLCPDLLMAPPRDMFVTDENKVLLHATNDIQSRGEGPLEIRGERTGRRYMSVVQAIHTTEGEPRLYDIEGRLVFYNIPKQGPYWKFEEAAEFELFSVDEAGERGELVRTGPKQNYCFRDYRRTLPSLLSPLNRVYPACSQDPGKRRRTLGTSVGWSDIYPARYHENWINVEGLRGCFEFVLTADPDNYLFENDETNNEGFRRIRLPPKGKRVRAC